MEEGQYIVLRETDRIDLSDPFSGPALTRRALPAREGIGIEVDVESLDKRGIAELRRDPEVVSIAPPIPIRLIEPTASEEAETRNEAGATWGVIATGATESPYLGSGVTVAILDTGIDANHEAFQGVEVVQRDFTGTGDGDGNGHGTHVAGTVFGREVNGFRFGVAPGVQRALIGKVLDDAGGGSTEQIYQGILWAAEQGAHIISMSLGFAFPALVDYYVRQGWPVDLATDRALEGYRANVRLFDRLAALMYARGALFQSTLLVAAAGNESKRDIDPNYELTVAPPAAADGIVSVGALQTTGEPHDALSIANFSNTGPNISGPGVDVYSAKTGGGYISFSGTSMATPHVAGIAALWAEKLLAETGTINNIELSARLIGRATRERLVQGFDPMDVGAGLVQAPLE